MLQKYLKDKYGENYDQKAQEDFDSARNQNRFAQLGSDLGDAIAGQKVGSGDQYFQGLNKQAKENTIGKISNDKAQYVKDQSDAFNMQDISDKSRVRDQENDINNPMVQTYRDQMAKFGLKIPEGMSIADIKRNYGDAKSLKEIEMRSQIDFNNQKQLRGMDQRFKEKESDLDRNLKRELDDKNDKVKAAEKGEKNKQAMNEINDRYTNMKSNIAELKKLVDQTSGGDLTGAENKSMDQYIEAIATDMAKLVDPSSVARESEVASFKRMLFEPGVLNNLFTRGSTIQKTVQNFENMLDKRLDTAYKVRGLEKPEQISEVRNSSGPMSMINDEDKQAYAWAQENAGNPKADQIISKLKLKMAGK